VQASSAARQLNATLASDTARYGRHPTPHMIPTVADWLACPIQCVVPATQHRLTSLLENPQHLEFRRGNSASSFALSKSDLCSVPLRVSRSCSAFHACDPTRPDWWCKSNHFKTALNTVPWKGPDLFKYMTCIQEYTCTTSNVCVQTVECNKYVFSMSAAMCVPLRCTLGDPAHY